MGTIAGQVISVGANELIVNGKTISYSLFLKAEHSNGIMLGGQSYIPAGIYRFEEPFPISAFTAGFHASTTIENVLVSAITIGAQKFTAGTTHSIHHRPSDSDPRKHNHCTGNNNLTRRLYICHTSLNHGRS